MIKLNRHDLSFSNYDYFDDLRLRFGMITPALPIAQDGHCPLKKIKMKRFLDFLLYRSIIL